jgi:hypothetical protein
MYSISWTCSRPLATGCRIELYLLLRCVAVILSDNYRVSLPALLSFCMYVYSLLALLKYSANVYKVQPDSYRTTQLPYSLPFEGSSFGPRVTTNKWI